ncbi:MAG TPA: transglycosylase SLT domain-containing protein [Terriglobales bacterium]|nr:transglycosylase SLT domain-containing protein [Terriglobales bacterium]
MTPESSCYPLIAAAAQRTGLDWWLIYGVIEQESGFDPASESNCGALGLMQLMPSSFPAFTRTALLDPATNVKLGAEHLRECIGIWRLETADEAVKFGLASYNGGPGYVLAAQHQAALAGEDQSQWAVVEPFLNLAEVNGKRPDVEQIRAYVARIWRRYAARRGAPVPTAQGTAAA